MNAFESGIRKAIPATLIYARRGDRILMVHRNARSQEQDDHSGKWNGLGGKCEPDESPIEGARRELEEESGLRLDERAFTALGVIQFPNFKPHRSEDWIVFVFTAQVPDSFELPARSNSEGQLHWVKESEILGLNLWPGDRHFIPYVLRKQGFVGSIWYRDGQVARHWIAPWEGK
jgi:8-oxo-dGTP diphosphatase